ncbi:MAG: HXXEE domain-containing protein [Sporolactobacillus sp.]
MNDMRLVVWFFPILFIFHDFEEIIFMQPWIGKNKIYLGERFPKLSKRIVLHFEKITTSSFALGVAEEYSLLTIVTVISYMTHWYSLWLGLFMAFTFHLIIHCLQALMVRKYVPALITSIICLPICLSIIQHIILSFSWYTIFFYSLAGIIIMVVNLLLIHYGMDRFSTWLAHYEQQGE